MRKVFFYCLYLLASIQAIAQEKEKYVNIADFLDGYAWQAISDELHPNRDLNYDLYLDGYVYSFFTVDGKGKELKVAPYKNWRIFFVERPLWDDNGGRIKIQRARLFNNYPIVSSKINEYCEINYVDFNGEILDTLEYYNGGSNQFILYKNKYDIIGMVFGKYISPTLILDYKRVKNPPKFVQDFILELKKAKLRSIKNKSFLYFSTRQKTKQYLLKGDQIEVINENKNFYEIRYYGKKTIEGWIKKSDVE